MEINTLSALRIEKKSYRCVWQRAKKKLRINYLLKGIGRDTRLYGPATKQIKDENSYLNYLKTKQILSDEDRFTKDFKKSRMVIHPDSEILPWWNYLVLISLLYTSFVSMFVVIFLDPNEFNYLILIGLLIDIVYIVDLFINCNTGFYDKNNFLVLDRTQIFNQYLKSWFLLDFISSIPYAWIDFTISNNLSHKNFVKLLKIRSISKILKIFQLSKLYNKMLYIEKIVSFLRINQRKVNYIKVFLIISIFTHIAGCFWYLTSVLDDFGPNTWVVRYGYLDLSINERYLASIYWALVTLITLGYGDISAMTINEKVLAMCWMIIAVYFLSFTVASITSLYSLKATKEDLAYANLMIASDFHKYHKISTKVMHKIKRSIRYFQDSVYFSELEKKSLLDYLPYPVKYMITYNMFNEVIKKFRFFTTNSESFATSIVPYLSFEKKIKNSHLWQIGETADRIFFIISGYVVLSTKENLEFISMDCGKYLGDTELFLKKLRVFNAVCKSNSEFLVMTNSFLVETIKKKFRDVYLCMKANAEKREKKIFLQLAKTKIFRQDCENVNQITIRKMIAEELVKTEIEFNQRRKRERIEIRLLEITKKIKKNNKGFTRILEEIDKRKSFLNILN